ncbi:MAG: LPS export ABC transporter periplasmic protein LptC [Pseudomonadota bacterium]|nr:LPS export ABC transporter periplasmic protein LptC [Pseudomonadota bacterium]
MKINRFLNELISDKKKISILLVLLLLVIWLNYLLTDAINFNRIDKSETRTNHFLNNFVIEQTSDDGNVKWTLNGDRLEKFPHSERSEVINPDMFVKSSDTTFWKVSASHALDPDSEFNSIYLTDNVKFEKKNISKESEVFITTSRAIIYPLEEKVETDAFATIITPDSKTTGDGVIANIKDGYVKILANAIRVASSKERTEYLQGDQLLYDLNKKSWKIVKKKRNNEKNQVQERVKTILKTKKLGAN